MRTSKTVSVLGCIILCFVLGYSCSKSGSNPVLPTPPAPVPSDPTIVYPFDADLEADSKVQVPPPANPGDPALPAVPYKYVSAPNGIPSFIADFIRTSPSGLGDTRPIDNTSLDNPITNDGATLGRVLFYDKKLSVNNTISCASCHHQDKAFTDGVAVSKGFDNKTTRRNAMSVVNLRYFRAKKMFWDMRSVDLETQTLMPIQDMVEMGMPSLAALEQKLKGVGYYPELFRKAFGSTEISADRVARALSQFLRSIVSFNSKYDRGLANNFADFTASELNGKRLVAVNFCTECHGDLLNSQASKTSTFLIADNISGNNGLDEVYTDKGIGEITAKTTDMNTFKIPSLRNVALTAPYMHDGRFKTLEEVLNHYATGIKKTANLSIQMRAGGIGLKAQDQTDIIAFLKTLTDASLAKNPRYSDPFK